MKKTKLEDVTGELKESVLYINRCAKVVKGGRKFSFSALVLVGDGEGHVGFGFAKANEVTEAIAKATEDAKKNIFYLEMKDGSIAHEVYAVHDGVKLILKPAKRGTGVVAGSMVRAVLENVGIKDIVSKNVGSNNPLNQVRATFKALSMLKKEKREEENVST
ncbi:MAG: 30S ribosomal protein S5 [Chlamydiae bacterium SM23_39]|nr:MAG: 30S ribosomal protein S5 [Chlamydiae bacterium SM23_39]